MLSDEIPGKVASTSGNSRLQKTKFWEFRECGYFPFMENEQGGKMMKVFRGGNSHVKHYIECAAVLDKIVI